MRRMVWWFCVVFVAGEIVFRNLTFGWGPPRVEPGGPEQVRFGVGFNVADSLFYDSLAQQARSGLGRFSNLYTVTEHPRLLVSPLFLMVGWLSRMLSTSPIAVLNVASLFAAVVFILCVAESCRLLGFGRRTAFVVLCLGLGGGGISWFRFLLNRAGLSGILRMGDVEGPDLYFLDLYPASAFTVYPFHSISLAMLALLTLLVIRFDDPGRRFGWPQWIAIGATAMLLATIRPYEPLAVLMCSGVAAALSMATDLPAAIKSRRRAISLCLAVGVIPPSVYSAWVSRQPVFIDWAGVALNLVRGANWVAAMFILWVLVAAAFLSFRKRTLSTPLVFLGVWSLSCAVILVVLSSGLSKLCGGCTIPLSLLAGTVIERGWRRVRSEKVRDVIAVGLACLALGSPALVHYSILRTGPPGLHSDILPAIAALRGDTGAAVPTVLAGPDPGRLLPGLGGFRVFYGIDGLDAHYPRRRALLSRLGFHPVEGKDFLETDRALVEATAREMLEQVRAGRFDYVMEDQGDTIGRWLDPSGQDSTVYRGPRYRVVKVTPAVRSALEDALQAIIEG
jgi:hypothetical protein